MESFEEIYSLYFKDIYRYVLSLCRNSEQAEEITQETFFQAMKSISSFRGDCKMTVWLCQIAKHLYFAQKRKEKHSAIMTLDEVSDHLPDTTSQPLELRIADETDAMRILEYLHDIEELIRKCLCYEFLVNCHSKKYQEFLEKQKVGPE